MTERTDAAAEERLPVLSIGSIIGTQSLVAGADASSPETSTRTAYSQSIDPVNIVMTEARLKVSWSWANTIVDSTYVVLSEVHHRELCCGGWNLDNYTLSRIAGCVGCASVTYKGVVNWWYQGNFDPTGTLFYNRHENRLTAKANGAYSCSYTITWRNSLPGWPTRSWCI